MFRLGSSLFIGIKSKMAAPEFEMVLTEARQFSWFPRAVKVVVGLGLCIMVPTVTYKVIIKILKRKVSQIREENAKFFQCQTGNHHDEGVSIESLATLCRSTHPNLRRCAQLLAIEKFLNNEKAVNLVFHQCLHGTTEEMNRACMIFCHVLLFIDSELDNRHIAYRKAIVQTICQIITTTCQPDFSTDVVFKKKIQKMALYGANHVCTFAFLAEIEAEDPIPAELFSDLCRCLLHLLKTSTNRDIQRLSLTILSVLAGDGQRESVIIQADGIAIIAQTFKALQGDTVFQRICLQLINANMNSLNADTPREILIKELKIVKPLLACLKSEDTICINLASILLYHLVGPANDSCLREIKSVRSAIRILTRVLCNNDVKQRTLMLRIIFMLAVDDVQYKRQVLQCTELLEKLAFLYLSSDPDVVSSALALTECLMLEGKEAISNMLTSSPHLLRHLSSVTSHQDSVIPRLVTEILCVCTSDDIVEKAVEYGVLPTIMHCIQSHHPDSDVLTQLAAMLLNVALASDSMKKEIMSCGGLQILMNLVFSGSGSSSGPGRILASRILIMLGSTDDTCQIRIHLSTSGGGTLHVEDQKIHFYNPGMHVMRFDVSDWTLSHNLLTSDLILSPDPGSLYIVVVDSNKLVKRESLPIFIEMPEQVSDTGVLVIVGYEFINGRLRPCQMAALEVDTEVWESSLGYAVLVDNMVRAKLCDLTRRAILAIRSPISKVAELNISQGLVHAADHAEAYLAIPGSVDYLLDMISAVVDSLPLLENLDPVIAMFAHGMAALEMIEVLVKHEAFYKIKSNLVEILVGLLQQMNRLSLNNSLKTLSVRQRQLCAEYQDIFTNLTKHAVYTIHQLLCQCDREKMRQALVRHGGQFMLWSTLLSVQSALLNDIGIPASASLAMLFAEYSAELPRGVCLLNIHDKTAALQISASLLETKNGSWTFESVRATQSTATVQAHGDSIGWYYEATILSDGILQLGWATKQCPFRAQKGLGVGDDVNSVAYDGERCKKWNGPDSAKAGNNYGKAWKSGDTITCMLSRTGQATYMLQGEPLGIAFDSLPMDKPWHPAVSLATDQQVTFNFGASAFRYPVPLYVSMCEGLCEEYDEVPAPDDRSAVLSDMIIPFNEQSSYHVPMVYFEVNLQRHSSAPLSVGMETIGRKRTRLYCTYSHATLTLPDGKVVVNFMDEGGIPVTLGVGYLLHQASIFFVVDGTPFRQTYPIEDGSKFPVVPYLSSPFVDVNFGAKYFVYDSANDTTLRMGCAALLIDYLDLCGKA